MDWNSALPLLAQGTLAAVVLMAVLWLIHLPLRNASIVDIGWSFGIALVALVYAIQGPGGSPRRWVMAAMAGLWGLRLGGYLLLRIAGKPEEGRYVALREKWKTNLEFKFLLFFQFQALLCPALSWPFLVAAVNPAPGLGGWEYAGLAIWAAGVMGEAIADGQLDAFKKDPRNKGLTCQAGLWNYSRHPNYFFEFLVWCGYATFALGSPGGWIAWISPAMILYFLFRVTGIPATEAQALRSRGEAYRRYQKSTSAFVPWFKKTPA
ncbi:MAG: DUF1295 domain-containing protein [Bryobacteraceae bacterium]|nr:DUF1295 domain-containing protein [Bryobacteraceae bacterium]